MTIPANSMANRALEVAKSIEGVNVSLREKLGRLANSGSDFYTTKLELKNLEHLYSTWEEGSTSLPEDLEDQFRIEARAAAERDEDLSEPAPIQLVYPATAAISFSPKSAAMLAK